MSGTSHNEYLAAARLIAQSRHMVAFTGAGISTPSGIPDFRSAGTGLWRKNDPMLVASATAFHHHPQRFYDWLRPLLLTSQHALPNPAHMALAELECSGILKTVITQNIDGLHQRAGSKLVIELHGSMQRFYCPVCHENSVNPDDVIATILAESIPKCKQCGSVIRPDITLFEEALPVDAWQQAEREIYNADLLLVAGSSLEVIPASSLPYEAYRNGCRIIIVNLSSTYLDQHADVMLRADVAAGIPQIVQELKRLM